jgi:hypothetical protein
VRKKGGKRPFCAILAGNFSALTDFRYLCVEKNSVSKKTVCRKKQCVEKKLCVGKSLSREKVYSAPFEVRLAVALWVRHLLVLGP